MRNSFKDKIFWLLFIFATIYIFGNIGTGSLDTWDEAIYANISAAILKTGDWLIMHDAGKPWFDKPPLYMWCTAIFYMMLGISEFSVRVTSGIFGLATIMLVYVFVSRVFCRNTAILSSLLLLAAPHYIHYSKMGMVDVPLTFFITLMVFLFWLGQENPVYLFWSGVILLPTYLTKGFAAITGLGIIFLYCLLSKNRKLLIKREFLIGIFISILFISAWHILQYVLGGPDAVNSYFGFHIFKRASTSLEGHTGGLNYYQKVIFNKNKPWGIFFYTSLVYMLWLAIKDKDKRAILIISWFAAIFIICSIVKTKLHWYIMPVYPALAMSSAIFLNEFFKKKLFNLMLALILMGMLIQVPVSWAFKLDSNPKVKQSALNSEKLPYVDNGSIFYYDTINIGKNYSK